MLEKDYFSILGLQKQFDICKIQLEKNYFDLSKSSKDPALLNEAYSTLKNDYKRANVLYNLNNSKTINDKVSTEFLNEVIELEDKIDQADHKELLVLKLKIEDKIKECKFNYFRKDYLNKWRYFLRLEELVEKRLEEFE
ncbi:hypothetical protein H311_00760, partial [Anncaliia algerae PRA109]